MFLPRASASNSFSSSTPDNKPGQSSKVSPFQQSPRRFGLIKTNAGQGGSANWSQPTTAPPSVQVHYHYLAGRYRDLSNERGLGLSGSGISSSTSTATLGGILESERDDAYSLDGDARSINLHPSPCKTPSASSSLRAIARKTTGGKQKDASTKIIRLQDLFGEKDKSANRMIESSTDKRREVLLGAIPSPNKKAKHSSLRSYAEERIKAQEAIESRIEQATDTGRLKWEARAAMLNSNFTLAILLYTRAAQIGSISAALSLANLYATGLKRGNKPMVVLVYRDPLRSLSWALEAARLLQRRTDAKAKKRGSKMTSSAAETDQPSQIVALLSRLLRSKQAGLGAASDTTLPTVRKRRSGKEVEIRSVWKSVCESMEWLDEQVRSAVPPNHDDGHSIGPDDDEQDLKLTKQHQDRTNVALIEALVASRRWIISPVKNEAASTQAIKCWEKFRLAFQSNSSPGEPSQGDLSMICQGSQSLSIDRTHFSKHFIETLDDSLTESDTPVISSAASNAVAHLESPSKRLAGRLARRKASLEELVPLDAHAKQLYERARRPSLLRHHSSSALKATISLSSGVNAQMVKEDDIKGSFNALDQRPRLSSSATVARLESLTLHSKPKQRSSLPKARRMSISPSLLFPSQDDDDIVKPEETMQTHKYEEVGMPSSSSVVSSLWKAAPLHARHPSSNGRPAKERVASLYGTASVATSEKINTAGSSTYAYDVDAALSRQQNRRRRGDSNASISTIASMLSTNPSIAVSVSESEYAKGHFMSHSMSSKTNGFDLRGGGAADSLRRIRKASFLKENAREIPTAPHLSDTLEDLIANSASYRAVNAKANVPITRTRRDSNASLRSLTAFTGNNQRQTSYGDMRPTSLFPTRASSVIGMPAICTDRGSALRSPTLSVPTSYFNVTSQSVNGTLQSRSRAPSHGAIGSLRLLGRQASSKSVPKAATTASTQAVVESGEATKQSKKISAVAAAAELTTLPAGSKNHQRSFAALDPTHSTVSRPSSQAPSPAGSIYHEHHDSNDKLDKPISKKNLTHHHNHHQSNSITTLDPALAEAEDRSGLKTTSKCTICQSKVVNAPVSKSGDVFCGRDCRIEMKQRRALEATKGQA